MGTRADRRSPPLAYLLLRLEVLLAAAGAALGLLRCRRRLRLRRHLAAGLGRGLGGRDLRLARLGLLGGRLLGLLPELRLLGLLPLDVLERHADDGLLELLHLARALRRLLVGRALLVHAPPRLGPAQFDRLDPLVEERLRLLADEELALAVPGDVPLAGTGVHAVLRVRAELRLDDHCVERGGSAERCRKGRKQARSEVA
mmetsp:Transcript_128087/g.398946  ORF Transcript_128087/g.398946 Transcript_128087/m.398946 type:complete len:201 (+) Transcript_128087:35-637(+)